MATASESPQGTSDKEHLSSDQHDNSSATERGQAPSPGKDQGSSKDLQALLAVANNASDRVWLLHIGFMTACVYILVVVFSTVDMDLLVGKGVMLPLIAVEVSIVGFYIIVPY